MIQTTHKLCGEIIEAETPEALAQACLDHDREAHGNDHDGKTAQEILDEQREQGWYGDA